ncbi:hypothetical protein DPMN_107746 [Dreissena polymorpha]|uniref:Uncharacterized protein n=1 Tax=Dreissena polymorpha TaxID=45954 RepID=A0A9D4QK88_DREPO|nr:hypothetical protein DPMN_107746 [Dreissena polymorpha]
MKSTKALPRYGSGHKSAGRTESQTEGRTTPKQYPSAYGKMPRPRGDHVFQPTGITFELVLDIIWMNLLTRFHEARTINVVSRVKNAPPPDIIGTNLPTKFHEDRKINVASRVKNAPSPWQPCFSSKDIIGTNLLTKFHEDRKINVASRVLTRKNAPPPGGHVFIPTSIIFELVQDIIGMNTINEASRVLTRFYYSHIRKNAPPLGSHVFQANVTIFELIQDIIGTNHLSKFHEDRKINVASRVLTRKKCPAPWRPYIIGINRMTKFHEDWTINVFSRVLTRFYYSHQRKNAPPLGSHTNLLTKFHGDWTINVASRELTRQMLTTHDGQKAITKAHHEHVVLR